MTRWREPVLLVVIAVLWSCGGRSDAPTGVTPPPPPPTAGVPAVITVVDGDDQDGSMGDPLPAEVRFRALNAAGRPVPGASVQLKVGDGGGTVPAEFVTTDSLGEVHTPWTLGLAPGRHSLQAIIDSLPPAWATASASACDLVNCADDLSIGDQSRWKLVNLTTYDGSGEVVHPDVVHAGPGLRWLWLAVTPYPGSDVTKENPSLFQSFNGNHWRIPRGLTNPVSTPSVGYLSDPDMVFDRPTHSLWMYYRQVTGENVIWLTRSGDGVKWDTPTVVVSAPNHQIVSPSVVHNAPHAPWLMFAVNTHANGCTSTHNDVTRRTSPDGMSWSQPLTTDLAQEGQTIWHLDVTWVPARSEYWALYNTYPVGTSCATTALYLARSSDGIHWRTYPSPLFRTGVIDAFRDVIYRSSMLVNDQADTTRFWVSGASYDGNYNWQMATTTRATDDFFREIAQIPPSQRPPEFPARQLPPPEPDLGPTKHGNGGIPATPPRAVRVHQ